MSIGQPLILGVPGTKLDADYARVIKDIQPGGFIIFSRNIESPRQLRTLMDDLRSLLIEEPILCIDQEGGRVARLRELGYEPPSAKELVAKGSLELIKRHGELTSEMMRLFGFNLNLCPVLDCSVDGDEDNSLKNRCWGTSPNEVIRNARAFSNAMMEGGILSCGKHFPGYSNAHIDPHHDLPKIERSRAELEEFEWVAFKEFVSEMDTVMMGHAFYPKIDDSGLSSSLSPIFIKDLLRKEWGFKGAVMTDDLDMGAIVNRYGLDDSVRLSVEAGNDFVLICHRTGMARQAYDTLTSMNSSLLDESLERIGDYKKKLSAPTAFSESRHAEIDRKIFQLRSEVVGEEMARQKSPENAKRSPVEDF